MKGLDATKRQFIFNSYTTRIANNLKDEIDSLGAIPVSQVEGAREQIMTVIRVLQSDGDIQIDFANEQRLI